MSYVRRTARLLIKLLALPLAAAIVAGCQGALPGGVSRAPASAIAPSALSRQPREGAPLPSWMRFRPMAGTGRVYVSMFNFTNVNEYAASNKKNAPPLCAIPNQHYVNGIGVDRSLNLWVPNANASGLGFTAVFAPSCGKQLFTIADKDGQPASVIFDRKGNAYVENIYGPPSNLLAGNVDVYKVKTRHKVAELTYKDPHTYIWSDEALDAGGDLFVIYSDIYNKGHVIEFPGAKNSGQEPSDFRRLPGRPRLRLRRESPSRQSGYGGRVGLRAPVHRIAKRDVLAEGRVGALQVQRDAQEPVLLGLHQFVGRRVRLRRNESGFDEVPVQLQ